MLNVIDDLFKVRPFLALTPFLLVGAQSVVKSSATDLLTHDKQHYQIPHEHARMR